jgi:hypothetical protein
MIEVFAFFTIAAIVLTIAGLPTVWLFRLIEKKIPQRYQLLLTLLLFIFFYGGGFFVSAEIIKAWR